MLNGGSICVVELEADMEERISRNKGIKGAALAVTNLLLCAEAYKSGGFTHETIKNEMFCNTEFIV